MSAAHVEPCPRCDGEGEVYIGSAVPDDEGYERCLTCGGSGKLPTPAQIADLRTELLKALGDLQAAEFQVQEWKARAEQLERDREPLKHGEGVDVAGVPMPRTRFRKRCVCGYEAYDAQDLEEHISYAARVDDQDHAEARW